MSRFQFMCMCKRTVNLQNSIVIIVVALNLYSDILTVCHSIVQDDPISYHGLLASSLIEYYFALAI